MLSWLLALALATATPALQDPPVQQAPPTVAPAAPAQAIPIPVPSISDVMAIPPELDARLRAALPAPNAPARERLDRLVAFLTGEEGLGLKYREDATLTVAEAYAQREANCLTFTLVFMALAPRAGLDVHAQEIEQTLTWYQLDNTVFRNSHVNAVVRAGRDTVVVDVSGSDIVSRSAPIAIPRERLLSHYYNNMAITLLAHGDPRNAATFSARAIELYPDLPDHWSNAGVIHARNGEWLDAARAYAQALKLDPDNAGALFNFVGLAHRIGDRASEAQLRRRLAQVQRRDPFHQFLLALEYEHKGELKLAIAHFRRAIHLHAGEHRFHAALARACLAAGDRHCAEAALAHARKAAHGPEREIYAAQLQALRAPGNAATRPVDPDAGLRRR